MSAAEEDAGSRAVEAWALLWAATCLFAITAVPGWYYLIDREVSIRSILDLAMAVVALAVVVRSSGARAALPALAVLDVGRAAYLLPDLPNHGWVMMLVDLAFLAIVARRRSNAQTVEPFRAFQRAARGVVIACYAFAFFAKLNYDFLDPATSCAAQFYANAARWLPLPGDRWALSAAVWTTLGIEGFLAAALLLARGRARLATVVIGIVFHLFLSLDPIKAFVNFSAVMTAGLVLFLPAERLAAIAPERRWPRTVLAAGFVVLVALGILASRGISVGLAFLVWRHLFFGMFVAFVVARIVLARDAAEEARPKLAFAVVAITAIAVANGLMPYLGLKTRTAFDMYSNLRLESARSNHLLVARSLDAFGLLADRVVVESIEDPELRERFAPGSRWPWMEFASRAAGSSERIVVVRDDARVVHDPAREERIAPTPWLLRKLLVFRPFGESTRGLCLW